MPVFVLSFRRIRFIGTAGIYAAARGPLRGPYLQKRSSGQQTFMRYVQEMLICIHKE